MLDNRLEIIIEIPNPSVEEGFIRYYLDTFNSTDVPIELNFSINDINDISNRNASSSKTITLPETPNNREVFGFISDLNSDTLLYSPNKRSKCYVLIDTVVVLEGWLQLKNIIPNYRTGLNKLECIIYSNQLDFFKAVGESYLQDLIGFKNQNFTHSISNMTASWFQNQTEVDYYYPLIDYGFNFNSDKTEISTGFQALSGTPSGYNYVYVDSTQIYPAIYLKSIIDAIFISATGSNYYDPLNGITSSITYQYDSYFFNSPFFRNLIVPFSNGTFTYQSILFLSTDTIFNSLTLTPTTQYLTLTSVPPLGLGSFISESVRVASGGSPIYKQGYVYNSSSATLNIYFTITGDVISFSSATTIVVQISYYNSSTDLIGGDTLCSYYINTTGNIVINSGVIHIFNFGDYFTLTIFADDGTIVLSNVQIILNMNNNGNTPGDISYNLNQSLSLPTTLPKNVKQKDFLNDVFKMFNLYIDYDPNTPNILRIEPRDDYYYFNNPVSNESPFYLGMNYYGISYFNRNNLIIKDWSDKVDINQDINVQLLAETQNKTIYITYKDDKDYYNDSYLGFTNRTYGNKIIEVDNDFNYGSQTIDVLFGPTVVANIYNTVNFPVPNLTKQIDSSSYIPNGRSNCNPKLMQRYWDYTGNNSLNIFDNQPLNLISSYDKFVIVNGTMSYTFSYYPYAGNVNNPYNPSSDLNFDQSLYYYFNLAGIQSANVQYVPGLNNNIYNCFYQNQFDEILDNSSKIITVKLYLTPQDIQQFRFSDLIYLRLGSSGQYYHVNKISNYDLTQPQKTVEVELIKVLEISNYQIGGESIVNNIVLTGPPNGATTNATYSFTFDYYVTSHLDVSFTIFTYDDSTGTSYDYYKSVQFNIGDQTNLFTFSIPIGQSSNGYSITSITPNSDNFYSYTF